MTKIAEQPLLFDAPFFMEKPMPGGFSYKEDFLTVEQETRLLEIFKKLPFEHAKYDGYEAQRRYVWYQWPQDDGPPGYLKELVARAEAFAGVARGTISSALIQEYSPGAPIGWHRDKPTIGHVIGISLAGTCIFRLRRKNGDKWDRFSVPAKPRSIYCMADESRRDWQHSIPPVEELRYSITLRDF